MNATYLKPHLLIPSLMSLIYMKVSVITVEGQSLNPHPSTGISPHKHDSYFRNALTGRVRGGAYPHILRSLGLRAHFQSPSQPLMHI
jgi:hypothetical protein